jgi:predicted nuclease with TOPRIM domain
MSAPETTKTAFDWLNSPGALAAIGTMSAIFGGAVNQYLRSRISSKKIDNDDEVSFRKELREEVRELRLMMKGIDSELTEWKDKYYELFEEYSDLKSQYAILDDKYKTVLDELGLMKYRMQDNG